MTPRCLKTVRLQQVYRLSVRMLCLGVSRLLPQGESLIQPDRIPKMWVLEGLSATRLLLIGKQDAGFVRKTLKFCDDLTFDDDDLFAGSSSKSH